MVKLVAYYLFMSCMFLLANLTYSVVHAAEGDPEPEPISEENAQVLELLFYATPAEVQQAFEWGFTLPVLAYLFAWAFGTVISFASK